MQPGKLVTEQELAGLERLAQAATPGPCVACSAEAAFIAAANPQTVLGLIAQIREHQSKNKALSELIRWCSADYAAPAQQREDTSVCESCGAFGGYHSEECEPPVDRSLSIFRAISTCKHRRVDDDSESKIRDTAEFAIDGCSVKIISYDNGMHGYIIRCAPCKLNAGLFGRSYDEALAAAVADINRHNKRNHMVSRSTTGVDPQTVPTIKSYIQVTPDDWDEVGTTSQPAPAEVAENRLINAARSALDFLSRYSHYFDDEDNHAAMLRIDDLRRALAPFNYDPAAFSPHQFSKPLEDHTWIDATSQAPDNGQKVVCLDSVNRGWYVQYDAGRRVYWKITGNGMKTGERVEDVTYWRISKD